MRLRTRLIFAFLLLAVVPLAGIVTYSYLTSLGAVRRTVEREARGATAEMNQRMEGIQDELRRRIERLGRLPLGDLLREVPGGEREEVTRRLLLQLGEAAPLVESFEFLPAPGAPPPFPRPPRPPLPDDPREGVAPPAPPPETRDAVIFEVTEDVRRRLSELEKLGEELGQASATAGARFGLEVASVVAEAFGGEAPGVEEVEQALELAEAELREAAAARALEDRDRRVRGVEIRSVEDAVRAFERARAVQVEREAEKSDPGQPAPGRGWLFRGGLEVPVREEGQVVGQVTTRIRAEMLLRQVLARARREQGEIPYALDAEGHLFVADEADREALAGLPLDATGVSGDWVISASPAPGSDLTIGIARPIREPLAEVRRTAARNFAYGLGLIALALVGILPLSRRMTRDLGAVTEGAERIAGGDLRTRVEVRSSDEIGQLAGAFNDMARDLQRHRERQAEQQRLEAEYARKTRELEEARQFQLSLLPRELPRHPSFEIAVHMQTANEVGGDYYDFHLGSGGRLLVAVGDATGHGARAGTMVTVVKSLFSAHASSARPSGLVDFLGEASRAIRRMDLERMAMTLTLARLADRALTVAAAGMPPVLVHRRDAGAVEEIALAGMPLGSLEFAYRERRVELAAGDTVLLMTDGFPELVGADGEVLGYARAREAFAAAAALAPREIVAELAAAVAEHTGGEPPGDDVTFVVVRIR